jgi:hypothetical protein
VDFLTDGLKSEMQHPAMLNTSADYGLSLFGDLLPEVPAGLDGAAPVQRLMRPVIQKVGDGVQCLLVMNGRISPLRKQLPQQSSGVLAAATLPWAVRVAEVHAHIRGAGQAPVPSYLFAAVIGERLAHGLSDLIELEGEGRQSRFGGGIRHLGQQYQTSGSLHQNAYGGLVPGTLDQVTFPVARHHSIIDLRRTQMNADHLRYLPSPVFASRARFTTALALTKASDQVLAQLTVGVRIDGGVDGLVRDMQFGFVGPHGAQCLRDLLRRPQPTQHVRHQRPKRSVRIKLRAWSGLDSSRLATRLSATRNVGSTTGIARQLAADRRRAATEGQSNRPWSHALQQHPGQRHALFSLHLLESSRHLRTLPGGPGVAFRI